MINFIIICLIIIILLLYNNYKIENFTLDSYQKKRIMNIILTNKRWDRKVNELIIKTEDLDRYNTLLENDIYVGDRIYKK